MTTATLHASLQRTRFTHHALAAIARWVPGARRATPALASSTRLSAGESASLEAQKVRDLAHSYAKTDPGFAADLYAAAARHEGQYGA